MHVLRRHRLITLFFVLPAFLLFTYFIVYAVGQTAFFSLTRWKIPGRPSFIGINNYTRLVQLEDFWIVMQNNFLGLIIALIIQLTLGLVFAYLLYRTKYGMRLFRSLVFVPVIMSGAAVALIFTLLFDGNLGPVNVLLRQAGLDHLAKNWMSDPGLIFYVVLFPMIYQYIGSYIIILLAGMQSISGEIIESAQIDGANSFQVFTRIVIPSQVDIILMCAIMITSGSFKAFEHSYIMTYGYSARGAFLGVYMYITSFNQNNFGRGSALAIIILVLSLAFTLLWQRIAKRYEY
jgi:raffinose/stachyose/melibiose transport system permease protein